MKELLEQLATAIAAEQKSKKKTGKLLDPPQLARLESAVDTALRHIKRK